MTWKEIINEYFAWPGPWPGTKTSLEFNPPASEQDIRFAEQKLKVTFPQDLKDLLVETNGVGQRLHLENNSEDIHTGFLIWPLERIIAENKIFREDEQITNYYMPFDGLLFFSDAGNGDNFGFAILNHLECNNRVYRWDHEDDRRYCVAHSLKDFIQYLSK